MTSGEMHAWSGVRKGRWQGAEKGPDQLKGLREGSSGRGLGSGGDALCVYVKHASKKPNAEYVVSKESLFYLRSFLCDNGKVCVLSRVL